jgi:serine/threonine protein kinase/tetratricopeptide (TPR) repeat protein
MSETLPQPFGRYVLTSLLGEGGMAEVYRASVRVAEGLTKWVVIKKIKRDFADQREFMRMFVDEAKIALGLNHANIVQVFDFGQVGPTFYLAMELIEGVDLMRLYHAVRAQGDAFPAVIAAYMAHQVASGLAYAHRKTDDYGQPLGIVHRDVSPHNIMLSWEGQVKVLDFGIARARTGGVERDDSLHGPAIETIKGKVAYMSPEQAMGRPVDQRSDIYSLGVVLYELLTGELLYRSRDRLAALDQVRNDAIPPILERAPDLPDELARIVDKALSRRPEDRHQNARELQLELAHFLHDADPVVDDDALSRFITRFRAGEEPARPRPAGYDMNPTREVEATHGSVAPSLGPRRENQRMVLVAFALVEPPPGAGLGTSAAADPSRFLGLVRDVAFKREAHVHRLDRMLGVLAVGTDLGGRDDGERAIRIALTLREAIGETAPGVGLGCVVIQTHAVVLRDEVGHVRVELARPFERALEELARRAVDSHVVVAGDLAERLARGWRLGEVEFGVGEIAAGHEGQPWAAELQQTSALLGPLSEAERRARELPGVRLLVGRELELKALRDAFAECIRARQSRAVLVSGGPGMGKHSLVERFVGSLPRGAVTVLRAHGQWSQRNVPFGAILELLRRFLLVDERSTVEQVARKLGDYGVEGAAALAEGFVASLDPRSADRLGLDPLERRDRLWLLLRRLTHSLALRRPVLVVLENLHFVDEESLSAIAEWTERAAPLPVTAIGTTRMTPRLQGLWPRPGVRVIELEELDDTARRELVTRRFEDPEEAAELAEAIVARTGGNPLFIEEVLASLVHRGVIGRSLKGRYLVVRDRGAAIEIPPSVEAALLARIDELAADEREALQGAAILGRIFRPEELATLLERPTSRELDHLVERDLVERESAAGRVVMRFRTVSLHEVCKQSVPSGRLEELHARAADLKRQRPDYVPGRDDGPIAEHLIQAGRSREAVDFAVRAARDARDVAGNREAYAYLTQALKAMEPEDPRRFDVYRERELILRAWGRRRAQGADIRQLVAIAEREADVERECVALMRLLRFYLECGRPKRGSHLVARIERRIAKLPMPHVYLAELGELRAELQMAAGRLEEAEHEAAVALAHCRDDRAGHIQRCRLLQTIGRTRVARGRNDTGADAFLEMLELAREIGSRRLEAQALNALGEAEGRSTRYQAAVDHFKAALAIDQALGDRFATGAKLANLGITYAAIGLYRRAERILRKALELHEAIGHPGLLNDVIIHLGDVVFALGDHEGAIDLLEEASDLAAQRDDPRSELRAQIRLGTVLFERSAAGDVERARSIARNVLERSEGPERTWRTARCRALHLLARLAHEAGDLGEAIHLEREAVALFRAGAAPMDGVLPLHHLGELLRLVGHDGEGKALLDEAAARVRARLDALRDPELRRGYEQQAAVRRVLAGAHSA